MYIAMELDPRKRHEMIVEIAHETSKAVLFDKLGDPEGFVRGTAATRLASYVGTDEVGRRIVMAMDYEATVGGKRSLISSLSLMRRPIAGRWLSTVIATSLDEMTLYYAILHMAVLRLKPSWAVRCALQDYRKSVVFASIQYFVEHRQVDAEVARRIEELVAEIECSREDWGMLGLEPGDFFRGREHVLNLLRSWKNS